MKGEGTLGFAFGVLGAEAIEWWLKVEPSLIGLAGGGTLGALIFTVVGHEIWAKKMGLRE